MQRHRLLRKREASKLLPLDCFEVEERIDAGKLNWWHRADNTAPYCIGIPALSQSKHLPALTLDTVSFEIPSTHYQHNYKAQQTRLANQFVSSPHTKQIPEVNKSSTNCFIVPTAGKDVATRHHTFTLRLDIDKNKNPPYKSAFSPKFLKRKFTLSASSYQQFSEDAPSSIHNSIQDLVTCGRKAKFSSSYDPTMPLTHSKARHNLVASVSRDYMLMNAKFERGKLILTNGEKKGKRYVTTYDVRLRDSFDVIGS